jgi:hypothetical protein
MRFNSLALRTLPRVGQPVQGTRGDVRMICTSSAKALRCFCGRRGDGTRGSRSLLDLFDDPLPFLEAQPDPVWAGQPVGSRDAANLMSALLSIIECRFDRSPNFHGSPPRQKFILARAAATKMTPMFCPLPKRANGPGPRLRVRTTSDTGLAPSPRGSVPGSPSTQDCAGQRHGWHWSRLRPSGRTPAAIRSE